MKPSIIISIVLLSIFIFHVQEAEGFLGGIIRNIVGRGSAILASVIGYFGNILSSFPNVIGIDGGPQSLTCLVSGITAPLVTLMDNFNALKIPANVSKIIFALLCGDLATVTNSLTCLQSTGTDLQSSLGIFNGIDFNLLLDSKDVPSIRLELLINDLLKGPDFNKFVEQVLKPCVDEAEEERKRDEERRKQCEALAERHTSHLYCAENNKCYIHSRFQRANGSIAKEICNEDKIDKFGEFFPKLGPIWDVNEFDVGGSAENCAEGSPFASRPDGAWTIVDSATQCKYTGVGADGRQTIPSTDLQPYPEPTVECNRDIKVSGKKRALDVICEATLPPLSTK